MNLHPARRAYPLASAPLPKFVIHRSTFRHELRKQRGTSNSKILVPLFDLKFLKRVCGKSCRNFKSAALAADRRSRKRLDAGLRATQDQRVNVVRSLIGADRLQ